MNTKAAVMVYGIKNCDTMKKAFSWLVENGIEYSFVDYKKAGAVAAELPKWVAAVGWEALLNRKGLTWKKLSETERADLDQVKACALMIAHPTLIKRPVTVAGNQVVVGFDPSVLLGLKG